MHHFSVIIFMLILTYITLQTFTFIDKYLDIRYVILPKYTSYYLVSISWDHHIWCSISLTCPLVVTRYITLFASHSMLVSLHPCWNYRFIIGLFSWIFTHTTCLITYAGTCLQNSLWTMSQVHFEAIWYCYKCREMLFSYNWDKLIVTIKYSILNI